jgi:hypothetical protein
MANKPNIVLVHGAWGDGMASQSAPIVALIEEAAQAVA